MGKTGKAIVMDLLRWIWLFMGSEGTWRLRPENPIFFMEFPLARRIRAPIRVSGGGRLSRGPNAPNRRTDL
jgi:hypothetical protein